MGSWCGSGHKSFHRVKGVCLLRLICFQHFHDDIISLQEGGINGQAKIWICGVGLDVVMIKIIVLTADPEAVALWGRDMTEQVAR